MPTKWQISATSAASPPCSSYYTFHHCHRRAGPRQMHCASRGPQLGLDQRQLLTRELLPGRGDPQRALIRVIRFPFPCLYRARDSVPSTRVHLLPCACSVCELKASLGPVDVVNGINSTEPALGMGLIHREAGGPHAVCKEQGLRRREERGKKTPVGERKSCSSPCTVTVVVEDFAPWLARTLQKYLPWWTGITS